MSAPDDPFLVIREPSTPRPNWRQDCEASGFGFHSMDGVYWDESHRYRFGADEVDELEAVTRELHQLSLAAVEHIVATDRFDQLAIAPAFAERIRASWNAREPALAGRFDLAYDGAHPRKLLEYNADTPTALLEASVIQWRWLQSAILPQQPDADQFNSLHEKLIANWRAIGVTTSANVPVHFSCVKDSDEDFGTIEYQRDVATQAGLATRFVYIEDIGWADDARRFVDDEGGEISMLCKLYPWEWLIADQFGPHLLQGKMRVIEPPWKMLLSNKGLLPILWDLNPDQLALIRDGNMAAAISLSGALLGFVLPLASAISHSVSPVDMVAWGVIALIVQLVVYAVTSRLVPRFREAIEAGRTAPATLLAALSVSAGILNAASMSY
ncbi:MAG: glutathionylspermidine synthase family protein [Pseudomonadota bacterium]|nr:glutathionylspermidine synthase family protein [Pseudomonadota bacterium]